MAGDRCEAPAVRGGTAPGDQGRETGAPGGLVVIGASAGGLAALKVVLGGLPSGLAAAVLVVQHRERGADDTLATLLASSCRLPVEEAEDKLPLAPGRVYLAPANYHLLVDGDHLALATDEAVHHARPSLDVTFESAALARGRAVIGVILTGANEDGARGLAAIKRAGGVAIVQDPVTAEAPEMPRAACAATAVDHVVPPEAIAGLVAHLTAARRPAPAPEEGG